MVVPATIEIPIDWEPVEEFRKKSRLGGGNQYVPSGLEIITCCVSDAMFEFDKFRSRVNQNMELELNEQSHIGLATSLPNDVLITSSVTVNRQDARRDIVRNVRECIRAVQHGESDKSQYHSLAISSMASQGVVTARPVCVYPAVATLFVGAPYWMSGGKDHVKKVCNLSLTFDHRVMNGDYAARFLRQISKNIKNFKEESIQ